MPDASPTKWHLAHITWFFETFLLERFEPAFRPFDPAFRVLFNSYYQGVGEQHPRPQRGLVTRPTLAEVKRYRAHVDERDAGAARLRAPAMPEIEALVTLGLQHEQQHQELILTDIKHALSCNPARGGLREALADGAGRGRSRCAGSPSPAAWSRWATPDARRRVLLRQRDAAPPRLGRAVRDRVAAGDLRRLPRLHGRRRLRAAGAVALDGLGLGSQAGARKAPLYWRRDGDRWLTHTLQGTVEIDPHTPVCHLSYFEADAFARWAGARLPTELEWEDRRALAARAARPATSPTAAPSIRCRRPRRSATSRCRCSATSGNGRSRPTCPTRATGPLPGAVGEYNGKFMCNQFVLRGGSCATPAGHVRASYRNFFPPDAQWQFSGVRLARDA